MNLQKLESLKEQVQVRYKAVIALLGLILFYLQVYVSVHPNHYVSLVILVLTVAGVHQAKNLEIK